MKSSERINGFDALRTIAMWLGIVLHAIIVYKTVPEANWPHDPVFTSSLFDWLYRFIHLFRMPLFFLVAGFFARLVLKRSGIRYFISQRFKRIVLPFIIGIIILVPLTLFPFHFYNFYNIQHLTLFDAVYNSLLQSTHWNGMVHLWFLYYLIIFYLLNIGIYQAILILPVSASFYKTRAGFNPYTTLLLGTTVLFFILYFFRQITPPVYTGIKLTPMHVFYYGFFYYTGWFLQTYGSSLKNLFKNSWLLFLTGTILSVYNFLAAPFQQPVFLFLFSAIETICLIVGIMGLFIKYFNSESKIWRYLSDASYWVYLIHMFIVVTTQVILINTSIAGWLRLPVVLIIAFTFSLLSYHYFVRFTIIGVYLHGSRPRNITITKKENEPVLAVEPSKSVI